MIQIFKREYDKAIIESTNFSNEKDAIDKGFCTGLEGVITFKVDTSDFETVECHYGSGEIKYFGLKKV